MKIPLHHNKGERPHGVRAVEQYELWTWATGANPKGFRSPPTSPKNPLSKSPHPVTPLERMAKNMAKTLS